MKGCKQYIVWQAATCIVLHKQCAYMNVGNKARIYQCKRLQVLILMNCSIGVQQLIITETT